MKALICSDIHGDLDSLTAVLNIFEREGCERLIILGDILYHGPRNDLPPTYAPKRVIELLNPLKDKIIAVRGNCDAEVDQMVLDFPIMDDFKRLELDGLKIFLTHGHRYSTDAKDTYEKGEILLHGHTHLLTSVKFGDENVYINPGSVSIPKGGNPKSFIIYSDRVFTTVTPDGEVISRDDFN